MFDGSSSAGAGSSGVIIFLWELYVEACLDLFKDRKDFVE